jgi:alpha-methylacyl-CoA racemase
MEMTDVCFAPILTMSEAAEHPHNVERRTFVEVEGVRQPAPAPRFSRTTPEIARPPAHAGQHTRDVLADWGLSAERVDELIASSAVRQAE